MTISRTVLAEAVLCTISDAIVAADERGIIQAWNPGAERIFGYTSGEAIGQSLDIIIPEQLRARHWLGYRQVMATGESRYGHGDILAVPGIRKDGERVPLRDEAGQMIGMAAIMRDVTIRFEEIRALRQKLAETSSRQDER
jgi:PAS domain S-box-containing protein